MAITKCECCKKNTQSINGIKAILKQLMGKEGEIGQLRAQAQMQACEGLLIAQDFTALQARLNEMEEKHPPFTYAQFRNILLIVWFIVISALLVVFYEQG